MVDAIEKVVKHHVQDPAVQEAIEEDWSKITIE